MIVKIKAVRFYAPQCTSLKKFSKNSMSSLGITYSPHSVSRSDTSSDRWGSSEKLLNPAGRVLDAWIETCPSSTVRLLHQHLNSPLMRCTIVSKRLTDFKNTCTVWVKKSPWFCLTYSPKRLVQILRAYYTFLSSLDDKFLFNYLQLWRSYAILSATTMLKMSTISWNAHWVVALNMA